jgi:hypothetical protein
VNLGAEGWPVGTTPKIGAQFVRFVAPRNG